MTTGCAWRRAVAVIIAAAAVFAVEGTARAQYFLSYAGGGAARRARDTLITVTQAEQSIDLGHTTLARWLFWAADGMIDDAADAMPDADAVRSVAEARRRLEEKDSGRASRALNAAGNELRRLAAVWDVGEAEPCCAALVALAEAGDCPAALAAMAPLEKGARMEPARALLDAARERVSAAKDSLSRGRRAEALNCAAEAKTKLRAAILALHLSRAKILVAHARIMGGNGARLRARWTLGRASRALSRAGALTDAAGADAAGKIRADIEAAREGLRKGENVRDPLAGVEAKIVALIAKSCGA